MGRWTVRQPAGGGGGGAGQSPTEGHNTSALPPPSLDIHVTTLRMMTSSELMMTIANEMAALMPSRLQQGVGRVQGARCGVQGAAPLAVVKLL